MALPLLCTFTAITPASFCSTSARNFDPVHQNRQAVCAFMVLCLYVGEYTMYR